MEKNYNKRIYLSTALKITLSCLILLFLTQCALFETHKPDAPLSTPPSTPPLTPSPAPSPKYTIKVTDIQGISIKPSGEVSVDKGKDQTFTITPQSGYKLIDVSVDGQSVGAVLTYTFTNITSNHTITAKSKIFYESTITGGDRVSIAIKSDGTIWAWGDNPMQYRGTYRTKNPTQIAGLSDMKAVALGGNHTIAVKTDGTVWAWGSNWLGVLGDGTETDRSTPVQVIGLSNVVAVGAGAQHSIALKTDGTVWTWGYNDYGALGDGTSDKNAHSTPQQVAGLTNITKIAGGYRHNLALKSDGTLWAWGGNSQGQLGDGTTTEHWTPVKVLSDVKAITGGYDGTVALKTDGTVWVWGGNYFGQLGDGTKINRLTPVQVIGISNVKAIAQGFYHTLALKTDGTIWAWGGYAVAGQIGNGSASMDPVPPVMVNGLTNIIAIGSGYVHSLAIKEDGTIWAWGANDSWQLGDGTTINRSNPVQVNDLNLN